MEKWFKDVAVAYRSWWKKKPGPAVYLTPTECARDFERDLTLEDNSHENIFTNGTYCFWKTKTYMHIWPLEFYGFCSSGMDIRFFDKIWIFI